MKLRILLSIILIAIVFILIAGCSSIQNKGSIQKFSETSDLLLNEQDLMQLGMRGDCKTEEYNTSEKMAISQYSFCNYTIDDLNTEIIIELSKYTNFEDLNDSYQYNSLHLRSSEGLISENKYGDQSRFYVNHESDYGGQFDESDIYYYHLWITRDLYLIHITSKGSQEAKERVKEIGLKILEKFK